MIKITVLISNSAVKAEREPSNAALLPLRLSRGTVEYICNNIGYIKQLLCRCKVDSKIGGAV